MNQQHTTRPTVFDYIDVSFAVGQHSRHLCWNFTGPEGQNLFHREGLNAGMVVLTANRAIKCKVTVYAPGIEAEVQRTISIVDCQLFAVPRQDSVSPSPFDVSKHGTPVFGSFLPQTSFIPNAKHPQPLTFESGDFHVVNVEGGNWDLSMILTAAVTNTVTNETQFCRYRFDPEGVGGTQDV